MLGEFRVRYKYKMAIVGGYFLGLSLNSSGSFCLSSAPPKPKTKTLAFIALGSHLRSWYQI